MAKKMKIWHPVLVSVFPILFLYSHNISEVLFIDLVKPLLATILVSIALWFVISILARDFRKGAVIASFYSFLFFSFGHFSKYLYAFLGNNLYLNGVRITLMIIAFWLFLYWLVSYLTIKRHLNLPVFNFFLNTVSLFLFVVTLVNIFKYQLSNYSSSSAKLVLGESLVVEDVGVDKENAPDIYYLIFDRYGSDRVLLKYFDFDNSEFTDFLEQEGFYVASDSTSNYLKTVHSLTSSLNMRYLEYLSEYAGENSESWTPVFNALEDNQVKSFLKDKGYKYYHFGSWWGHTSENSYADVNINTYPLSDFSMTIYKNTILYPFGSMFEIFDERILQWERVNNKFEEIAKVAQDPDATYVFAHFLVPHSPYVFDENGEYLEKSIVNQRNFDENYLNQIKFVNLKVGELVGKIKGNSDKEPIIIIQADEGPSPPRYVVDPYSLGTLELTDSELEEKMGILSAYFFPDGDYDLLYPSITPVNSFRVVFNEYFCTELDLLPDNNYVFEGHPNPYRFKEVTNRIKKDTPSN